MQSVLFRKIRRLIGHLPTLTARSRRALRDRFRDPLNIAASLRALNNLS